MVYYLSLTLLIALQPAGLIDRYEDWYMSTKKSCVETNHHSSWNDLLQKYVDEEGNVDYIGFKKEETDLDQYLDRMAQNAPADGASSQDLLVYYINLYNAATVKLILENYPVSSIKDIKSPWVKKRVKVGDNMISLGAIEHKILRKLGDPRIHFAINCASNSCPKIVNKAYTLENLETQLEDAARGFINDTKRNRIDSESAQISQIFKWFKADFTRSGNLVDYINRYSTNPIGSGTKVQYIKYDWSLNEAQ